MFLRERIGFHCLVDALQEGLIYPNGILTGNAFARLMERKDGVAQVVRNAKKLNMARMNKVFGFAESTGAKR